jgi:tetratricopeptide (TPR) repeat protein
MSAVTTGVALRTEFGAHEATADSLVRLSELLQTPRERALYLYTVGTLHETYLENPAGAEEAYTRAIEADPEHLPAAMALAHLYDGQRQWNKLCRALERLAELVPDSANKMRLLVESGSIHLDRTGDVNAAARNLHRASLVDTTSSRALARLAYAYEASGRTRELVETLQLQLDLTSDDSSRAALLTRTRRHLRLFLASKHPWRRSRPFTDAPKTT